MICNDLSVFVGVFLCLYLSWYFNKVLWYGGLSLNCYTSVSVRNMSIASLLLTVCSCFFHQTRRTVLIYIDIIKFCVYVEGSYTSTQHRRLVPVASVLQTYLLTKWFIVLHFAAKETGLFWFSACGYIALYVVTINIYSLYSGFMLLLFLVLRPGMVWISTSIFDFYYIVFLWYYFFLSLFFIAFSVPNKSLSLSFRKQLLVSSWREKRMYDNLIYKTILWRCTYIKTFFLFSPAIN